jgi:hypothetical protein
MKKIIGILFICTLFLSCAKEETQGKLTIDNDDILMHHNDEISIAAQTTTGNPVYFKSLDEIIVKSDVNGNLKGGIIGETLVMVTDGINESNVKVTVVPKYKNATEPFIRFGSSMDEVKMNVKGFLSVNNSDYLIYTIKDDISEYKQAYYFDNNKLVASENIFNDGSAQALESSKSIAERYVFTGSSSDGLFHKERNNKFYIMYSTKQGYTNLPYTKKAFFVYTINTIK